MTWVDGETTDHVVTAVYHDRMTFGDVIVSTESLAGHVAQDNVTVVLVDVADGVDLDAGSGGRLAGCRLRRPRADGP